MSSWKIFSSYWNNRFAPHDTAHLVKVMGGKVSSSYFSHFRLLTLWEKEKFVDRLEHFFNVILLIMASFTPILTEHLDRLDTTLLGTSHPSR